jgi:DNA-binding response OmpR family regulator
MRILIVDDQELVLLSLEKCLTDLGYNVRCSSNVKEAIDIYDEMLPHLVITDINMPIIPDSTFKHDSLDFITNSAGLEIVKYVKVIKKHKIPVMILSGNTDEEILLKGFNLGADDFMKKPLSLVEIGARVKRLIGSGNEVVLEDNKNRFIQDDCIGVVIPCYNEEKRLLSEEFKSFVHSNLGYHLCFVNDGSKDKTLEVLEELRIGNEDRISIYNCEKNGGKAEAVRLGMLHLAKEKQFNYIGFLDADLSTNFDDFKVLVKEISSTNFKIVSGSRMVRMGADIEKESARAIISKTVNLIIRKTLGMNFKDTQCGAKIMTKDVVETTFQTKFLTKWLFDVEIFMRMRNIHGLETAKSLLCEKPLDRWIHMDGSKLSFKDSFKILGQIGQIAVHYR